MPNPAGSAATEAPDRSDHLVPERTKWQQRLRMEFADRSLESAFRVTERSSRAGGLRVAALIVGVLLFVYLTISPALLSPVGAQRMAMAIAPSIFFVALAYLVSRTDIYLRHVYTDVIMFSCGTALLTAMNAVLFSEEQRIGHDPHAILLINSAILLLLAPFAFAGSSLAFLVWVAAHSLVFGYVLLALPGAPEVAQLYTGINYLVFLAIASLAHWAIERRARTIFLAKREIEAQRGRAETLLFNVLPPHVVDRIHRGEIVADAYGDVTVVFVDLVGFSSLVRTVSPGQTLSILARFFHLADTICDEAGLEKVKTVGDGYIAVAGGVASGRAGPEEAIRFAVLLLERLNAFNARESVRLEVRAGVHTGSVVGGVIGKVRMAYDYWGDTMNVAGRLQGAAEPGSIAASEATYLRTCSAFRYDGPEVHLLKGIGETVLYVLKGPCLGDSM